MSGRQQDSLQSLIKANELQLKSRSDANWYGRIVFLRPEELEFHILVFIPDQGVEAGGLFVYSWKQGDKAMKYGAHHRSEKPIKDGDRLTVTLVDGSKTWINHSPFGEIKGELVEVFLDTRYRSKILDALNTKENTEVLRWLQEKGLPIYRKLLQSGKDYETAVLLPKLDFLMSE